MRRSKIHQILPPFAPIGTSHLIFTNLNPYSPNMLPTKFGWNHFGEKDI